MDPDDFVSDLPDEVPDELDFAQKKSYSEEVYRDVWLEFFTWEQEECRRAIFSLRTTHPRMLLSSTEATSYHSAQIVAVDDEGDSEVFCFDDLVDDSSSFEAPSITDAVPAWQGCPRYFCCTPISQSVQRDTAQDFMLPFVPFADDPNFEVPDYLGNFNKFAWQEEFHDPDREEIQKEALRRLIFGVHKFTLHDVDDLGFFDLTRITNASGLLWDFTQRDPLIWPGAQFSNLDRLPTTWVVNLPDVFADVSKDVNTFCPNLNCLHTYCSLHAGKADVPFVVDQTSGSWHTAPIEPAKATETNDGMKLLEIAPCGALCFKFQDFDLDEYTFLESSPWSDPDDVTSLEAILKLAPDAIPCDLAIICRKPCYEVFIYRSRLLPDEKILDNVPYDPPSPRDVVLPEFSSTSTPGYTPGFSPLSPCHHNGPCDRDSGCHCYKESHYCGRNCRCSLKCPIRWQGCKCGTRKKSSGPCDSDKCPCRAAARECDPELCVKCDARGRHKKKRCQNNDVQKGRFQPIKIAQSKYGNGAYSQCALAPGVIIGEYVGELIAKEGTAVSTLEELNKHSGLNYVFDLDEAYILDSAIFGNETRYLNHRQEANCLATVVYVNGVHRIILLTSQSVENAKELFLNYGETYWTTHSPS